LGKGKNRSANIDDKGHKSLVDAAVKGGVKRFIYSSISGVSENSPIDFYSTKYVVEQYIQRSGIGYTILRLPAFMETHVQQLLGKSIIEKGKATILGKGDNPTNFIAVDDVVQAMEPIIESSNYENKVVQIAGPENLSRNEVVKLYASALNIKPRIRHVPVAVLNVLSKVINPFHEGIGRIMRFSAYNDVADATMDPSNSILRFGLQPTTVETFIRKQVAAGKRV
jgi:NADH dehydrogenase